MLISSLENIVVTLNYDYLLTAIISIDPN